MWQGWRFSDVGSTEIGATITEQKLQRERDACRVGRQLAALVRGEDSEQQDVEAMKSSGAGLHHSDGTYNRAIQQLMQGMM
jgi:hypothetical protein